MNIRILGKDRRSLAAGKILEGELGARAGECVLLPIPSADGTLVRGTQTPLDEAVQNVGKGTVVIGYGIPRKLAEKIEARGGRVADLSADEAFLRENARLTAEGAIGYLYATAKAAPRDLSVGVIGYGRIGRELVRLLLFLSTRVRVLSKNPAVREELGRYGVEAADSCGGDPSRFSGLDVLINTAPAQTVGEGERDALSGIRVIELASGKNFPEGMPVEHLPGIPSVMFPESGAKLYAAAAKGVLLS